MSPTQVRDLRARTDSGLRVTASRSAWAMCPPSSTGIGRRFMSPRFTLMSAILKRNDDEPLLRRLGGDGEEHERAAHRLEADLRR